MKLINFVFIFVLFLTLFLLSYTVYKSNETPVEHENLFSLDYQSVSRQFNQIKENEKIFNDYATFSYKYINDKLIIDIKNKDMNTSSINILSVKALLTRPHTNKNNKNLMPYLKKDTYIIDIPKLSLGKWRINLSVNINIKSKNIILYKHIYIQGK